MPPCKRKKVKCYISLIDLKEVSTTCADNTQGVTWQSIGCTALNMDDRSCIISGDKLNNKHVNFTQMLIKQQLKHTEGLKYPVLLATRTFLNNKHSPDFVHSRSLDCYIVAMF